MCTDGPFEPVTPRSFVSFSFSRIVAESHFDAGDAHAFGGLLRASVSVQRLFMTFYETRAMNESYKEAEAALLDERGTMPF